MSHQGCHTSSLNGRGQGKGSKCPAERRFVFWPRAAPCQLPQNNRLARFIAFLSFPPPVVGEPRSGTGHGEVWWCVTRGAEQSFDRTRVQARARKKGCDCTMGRCGADAPLPPPIARAGLLNVTLCDAHIRVSRAIRWRQSDTTGVFNLQRHSTAPRPPAARRVVESPIAPRHRPA
jgi:hypothetical protein